jgi:DNA helicase II / ATP-dependent DNA helicase PcrA
MSVKIEVTDKDIEYAEDILLPAGRTFKDEYNERIGFIKNFETIDLHAVPGSGKTTVLLAKLLILEKQLPFKDGSGVLVLSHTNTAVDEITKKIGDYCPKLFSYPNFVGTIQSFVNLFLAIPYYKQITGKRILRIDDAIYNENIERFYYKYLRNNYWLNQKSKPLDFLKKLRFNNENNLVLGINEKKDRFPLNETTKTYKELQKMKLNILNSGILCFDDAYYLAKGYLTEYSEIKSLLQRRFSYVFVDEMQDMDVHQYEILEKIFYDIGNSKSVYQRIGDRNQAIFGGEADFRVDNIWKPRKDELKITGTYRLSDNIASVVENLALDGGKITSICEDKVKINPYIFVYNDDNYNCKVIQKFIEIIKEYQEEKKIPVELENPVKAVSWVVRESEERKVTLPDYCPKFNRNKASSWIDFNSLESYLINCENNYRDIYNSLLNAFLKVLRIEGIKHEGRFFTKWSLMKYLRDEKAKEYERFKLNLYLWSTMIIRKEKSKVLTFIRNYISHFISLFDKSIKESYVFINEKAKILKAYLDGTEDDYDCDLCKLNGKKIEINSVHSVKGETHTATLYLESYYQKDGRGENTKSYESQRLSEQFKNIKISPTSRKRVKQSAKMVYVGFSRPTHLLAFAVHKERYNKYLKDINTDFWKVIDVDD